VAEIPAISGCYALMPTREQALEELNGVFQMISEEYREKGPCSPPLTRRKSWMPSATAREFQNAATFLRNSSSSLLENRYRLSF